jgi:uncharacterized repeat protein (TIGR01451 family)
VQVIPPGAPDLAITMSHDAAFTVGEKAVYNLTITNIGGAATAGAIIVTDSLPPGLTWAGVTGSDWSCSEAEQAVTCISQGPIESGASSTFGLAVDVGPKAAPGVSNLAVVSNESDWNTSNNSAGDPAVVLGGLR